MTAKTLSEKKVKRDNPNHNNAFFWEKDVKEKIQNAHKKLKEEVLNLSILEKNKDLTLTKAVEIMEYVIINKIFKEEFGDELLK